MGVAIFRILVAVFLPVVLCAVYYQAERCKRCASYSHKTKQVFIGISFGVLAILATEFGIPMNDAVLNVRDTGPLAAGLIFGWPAGLIAGLIGGIERWFAVLWGASEYTRLAGSLGGDTEWISW